MNKYSPDCCVSYYTIPPGFICSFISNLRNEPIIPIQFYYAMKE